MSHPLIVTDGVIDNYWFDDFFKKKHSSVVVKTSSGTDSSLMLFFILKFAQEINSDLKIYPFIGIDIDNLSSRALPNIIKIIEILSDMFPKPNLQNLEVYRYSKLERRKDWNGPKTDKNLYIHPIQRDYAKRVGSELVLTGSTLNMPVDGLTNNQQNQRVSQRDNYDEHIKLVNKDETPWAMVDKKFIAHQYKKFQLMETIYPLTESCIASEPPFGRIKLDLPCKKCYWCREKYWAFGSYDGGIQ